MTKRRDHLEELRGKIDEMIDEEWTIYGAAVPGDTYIVDRAVARSQALRDARDIVDWLLNDKD